MRIRTAKGLLLGLAGAAVVSVVCAVSSSIFAGYSRHPLEAAPWVFAVSAVPSALAGVLLATAALRSASLKPAWLMSIVLGYGVAVVSGSAGAIAVEGLHRGLHGVNVSGYLVWCWVYAFILLPLTAPLAHGVTPILWQQNSELRVRQPERRP